MAAKLRQLGCVCVAPTPLTHACADVGRSVRRAVAPVNTMRTVAVVDPDGVVGDDEPFGSSQPSVARLSATVKGARACEQNTEKMSPPIEWRRRLANVQPSFSSLSARMPSVSIWHPRHVRT